MAIRIGPDLGSGVWGPGMCPTMFSRERPIRSSVDPSMGPSCQAGPPRCPTRARPVLERVRRDAVGIGAGGRTDRGHPVVDRGWWERYRVRIEELEFLECWSVSGEVPLVIVSNASSSESARFGGAPLSVLHGGRCSLNRLLRGRSRGSHRSGSGGVCGLRGRRPDSPDDRRPHRPDPTGRTVTRLTQRPGTMGGGPGIVDHSRTGRPVRRGSFAGPDHAAA